MPAKRARRRIRALFCDVDGVLTDGRIYLDGRGIRCALALDGVVRYVGARDQCVRRAEILAAANDRALQDLMLVRALQ